MSLPSSRAMPATPGQYRAQPWTFLSLVPDIRASGWVWTGMESTKPTKAPTGAATGVKAMSAPRRKVNSAFRSGYQLCPSPVPSGSPVWAMNQSITRCQTRLSKNPRDASSLMRSTWAGAISGASSTKTRPLLVSMTSRFSGAIVRHSPGGGGGAGTAVASCARAAPAVAASTAAAIAIVRIVIVPSPVCESLSRPSLRRPAEHRRR